MEYYGGYEKKTFRQRRDENKKLKEQMDNPTGEQKAIMDASTKPGEKAGVLLLGAAQGAMAGASLGPVGAIAGGVIGLTTAALAENAAENQRIDAAVANFRLEEQEKIQKDLEAKERAAQTKASKAKAARDKGMAQAKPRIAQTSANQTGSSSGKFTQYDDFMQIYNAGMG